jgi:hypothetical protein
MVDDDVLEQFSLSSKTLSAISDFPISNSKVCPSEHIEPFGININSLRLEMVEFATYHLRKRQRRN